ncbi:hypothetical protein NP493_241g01056 [Ridgeia piscesae]|uniref:Uncharacterized protein n=1 Tax=Ridgeia piscesae TaxID=27915 RepID=A0AAD9NZ94_RIDPI|nr:hypothetical protein NP493_241g01056 [Ridgeia piscesae]
MSESDATELDSTARSNIGEGAESAGGGLGQPPPRPIRPNVACAGWCFPPSGAPSIPSRTPEPKERTGPKLRWTAREVEALAAAEDRLRAKRCRNINLQLHQEFPDRTLEAIKGKRRLPRYRAVHGRSRVR